jgi:predicted AAA+ superfamily ATPase
LLLNLPNGRLWAIEIKRSLSPKVEKGFYLACADLQPERKFIVYPGDEGFPMSHGVEVVSVATLAGAISQP